MLKMLKLLKISPPPLPLHFSEYDDCDDNNLKSEMELGYYLDQSRLLDDVT